MNDLRIILGIDGFVPFIWYLYEYLTLFICLRETSQEISFLLFFDDVKTKEFGRLWRPKMHKNVYILHDSVCVAPSIHTLFVRACNVSAVW